MGKRTRTTGAITGLLGGVALLAGCGQAGAIGGNDMSANSAAKQDISASNCAAQDFTVELTPQPQHPDQLLLAMTNTSDEPCELGGWVNLTPQNMAGEPIEQVPSQNVEIPGAPKPLTLQPGRTAFSGVHLELGSKSDPNAYVATGFIAKPADMEGEVNAHIGGTDGQPAEFPLKSLQVGTLQPSPQGVLF